ncbi:hypothetical protein BTUL_0153g00230 [Botrytis tulipae]|uniref:Uncharacterized protein n=1 Tax=Botrytis tulipae TaxID=87230 RepID=A0A4Z1ELL9_9HELO|nr:hypothetical protein BTUL_0153g00230 [Botrytis tulipae]
MEPIETSFQKSVEREFTDVFGFAEVDLMQQGGMEAGAANAAGIRYTESISSLNCMVIVVVIMIAVMSACIQSVGGPSHNEIGTWKGAFANTCCMQGHYNQLGRNQIPGSQLHVLAELLGMLIGRAKRFFGGTEMTVQGCQIDTAI